MSNRNSSSVVSSRFLSFSFSQVQRYPSDSSFRIQFPSNLVSFSWSIAFLFSSHFLFFFPPSLLFFSLFLEVHRYFFDLFSFFTFLLDSDSRPPLASRSILFDLLLGPKPPRTRNSIPRLFVQLGYMDIPRLFVQSIPK
jgi:hypothetical protein